MLRILTLLLALSLSSLAQSLDDARRNATRPMDVSTSLDLLARTLAKCDDDKVRVQLLQGMQDGRIKRSAVPAYVSRALSTILGDQYTKVFGSHTLTGDKEALIAKYKKLLTPSYLAKADPPNGRAVYLRTCQVCHLLFGEGTTVGPDLTGSNRANLDYILLNILDPSGDIPDAYQLNIVTTRTQQVVSGTVVAEDDGKLVLNVFGRHTTILKSDIAKRDTPKVSMMPEGLLATLQDHEVRDLIKYLQSPHQIDLPK